MLYGFDVTTNKKAEPMFRFFIYLHAQVTIIGFYPALIVKKGHVSIVTVTIFVRLCGRLLCRFSCFLQASQACIKDFIDGF